MHYTARTLALGQNGYVYASSWDYPSISEGLWVSFNQGTVWQGHLYLIGSNNNIFSILVRDNNQTSIHRDKNRRKKKHERRRQAFNPVNNGIPANSWVRDIEADSAGVLAAATTNGLFISTNNAVSWQQATGIAEGDTVVRLAFNYSTQPRSSGETRTLLAGTVEGKLYQSEDFIYTTMAVNFVFGLSEISDIEIEYPEKEEGPKVMTVLTVQNNGQSTGCNVSTNNGSSWMQFNNGIPPLVTLTAAAYGSIAAGILAIFLGTDGKALDGAKIFKWLKTIGIKQISSEVPDKFSLSQNYPNPFNPMTKIKFKVSRASDINITVFDVLGQHVTTLVNERLNAGSYETQWNAADMPGGVYFYRLETDDFTETKKMILVK